jgi:hypothetical protein
MKLDYLKEKKELVATALFAVSALSAVLIVLKVSGFLAAPAKAEETAQQAIERSKPDPNNVKAQLGKNKKVADALKKQNLFSPPPPPRNPVSAVLGVFGDEAFINGKWYKAGAKVQDAKIVAVTPTAVTVEWNGKTTVFNPIDGGASSGPGGPSRPGRPSSSSSRPGRAGMVVTEGPRPGGGRPGMGGGMPGMGGMTRERMMNMSEADRERFRNQMRERFENMSESERDRFRQEMRERMGGGRGGPGGGRGGPGGGRGGRR